MIERLYYLLLMSGGKMIRRIRAAPSTLFSAVGGLTRGAVSAAESITQTRVSAKGELVSQEYRYTAVAKMQIHAAAIATTAVETLEGAAKTALAATAAATRAERQDISGQSNDGFSGTGNATPLWVEKLEAVTASAFRAVGSATTNSFAAVAGRSVAAFAANAAAALLSVVTVSGYPQMAAAAIGNLAQVNAPVSAAAFAATAAIGVLNSRQATVLTGRPYTAMSARGTLLGNTNTLHGDGSTMADANGQAQLLTGRMAASRTSTAVSAQGTADAHATRRGRADTEVSATGQAVVDATKRGRTDTEVSATGQTVVDATKRGRAGTFVSAIAAVVRTETSRSRPETVISAAASATIAQNAASDTKTAVRAQGSITTAILRYISATASMTSKAVGNATAAVVSLAGRGATAVLSVGHLMLQNFRGQASTAVSAAGQITPYQGQWVDGKTKTKASAVGALTAVEARALQGKVKALVAASASAVTSGTQRAFTSARLSAQGVGTVLSGAMIRGAAGTGVTATATATYQALLLHGSTATAGSATGSASVNTWFIYNRETEDLYIRQTVSANQNGSRLTVLNHYPHTND